MKDSFRSRFYHSWMIESPELNDLPRNDLGPLSTNTRMDKEFSDVEQKTNGKFPIFQSSIGNTIRFYCVDSTIKSLPIIAIVECRNTPENLEVVSSAKNKENYPKEPFMSDLYLQALDFANNKSLKFRCDETLTNDGLDMYMWKRFVSMGLIVSVYNITTPGATLITLDSPDKLEQFTQKHPQYKDWRFVLSNSSKHFVESVRTLFDIRRIEENSGLSTHPNLYE